MKKKHQIFLIALLYNILLLAQPLGNTFNTAAQTSGSGLIPLWNNIPTQADLRWTVSVNGINGTYNPAWHVTRPFPNWCIPGTSYAWIVNKYSCDPVDPTYHNCITTQPPPNNFIPVVQDLYYRINFNLASTVYAIDLDFWADNKIVDVCVNSTSPIWTPNGGSFTTNGFLNFKWCSNWVIGLNYIIVHVQSPAGNTGFMVKTNPVTPISINGPSNICQGSSGNNFSIPIVSGATSYAWTLPATWSGSPLNTNATNVTAGSNSGNIFVTAHSGTACLASVVKPITILPAPILNINASNNPVCQGSPVTLTGSGGMSGTYNWTYPGGPSSFNPITVNPNSTTIYNLSATGANGCIGNQQITVNVLPGPVIGINAVPPFICPGTQNILTANGTPGTLYNWTSPGLGSGAIKAVTPGQGPVTYNVTGTGPNGCVANAAITLLDGPLVTPIVSNQTLCDNATTCTLVTGASAFTGGPITYNWSGPGIPPSTSGANVNICPPNSSLWFNGQVFNYQVTGSSPAGCPVTSNFNVTITNNCCSQSTTGLTPLTSISNTLINGGSYFLENNITVSGSNSIKNLEILMMPGVKITIPNGQDLYLEHVHLYACGLKMWQGFEIQDGGKLSTTNLANSTSLIEDAEIAIDLPGTSLASAALMPLSLNQVVFNRNHIGIHIRNADPTITQFPIALTECVFSSRDIQTVKFPITPISWPGADIGPTGLRFASSSTTALAPPYNLQGFTQVNLKASYHNPPTFMNQPAHIGIKIENVGNTGGNLPNQGVIIGATSPITINNAAYFNLFDGLGTGIEITDASLSTSNNVFQNMQNYLAGGNWTLGKGIYHTVSGPLNARLDLKPIATIPSSDFGSRFWNCWLAVTTNYVYEVDIEQGIYRSNRTTLTGFGPGSSGIVLASNRFKYNIKYNELNNIDNNIWLGTNSGPYNIGANSGVGTFADKVVINENYIGKEVNSTSNVWSGYSGRAITINGPGLSNWQMAGSCEIISNKINRVHRGIRINAMEDYPIEIGGNEILVEDNNSVLPIDDQYGIYANDSKGNLIIQLNIVDGNNGVTNQRLKLIRCVDNTSSSLNQSPKVILNEVSNAYIGFAFEGNQPNTDWLCNRLSTPMTYGFSLEDSGVIGTQGQPCLESGNHYLGTWTPFLNYYTSCDGTSNPANSVIYAINPPGPTHNGIFPNLYVNGSLNTFIDTFTGCPPPGAYNDCAHLNHYPTPPSQRLVNSSKDNEGIAKSWLIEVYPNPSNGNLTISSANDKEIGNVRIMDITGKLVFSKDLCTSVSKTIDISFLKASLYIIEIENEAGQVVRKKLVKE